MTRQVVRAQSTDASQSELPERVWVEQLFDRLFPICRSIAGPGLRESLDVLSEVLLLEVEGFPSGTPVFDWEIPSEWHVREAWLKAPSGEIVADFGRSNLELVNRSEPVDRQLSLDELRPHLHSIPERPHATPYVTSYYKPTWGFCLPHAALEKLTPGIYHAHIDSSFEDGELNIGQAVLPGESKLEVQISSYLCHPSLANNELSGPLVLAMLYRRLARWERRRFTYRFLLNPETIGAIAYLCRYREQVTERLWAGLVLTCVGGSAPRLSYKATRRGDTVLDRLIDHAQRTGLMEFARRPFAPETGSDERQFCSPGFNLPVGQLARDVYGQYDGYHNSLDTKQAMGIDSLIRSADDIERLLSWLEHSGTFVNTRPYGEPFLTKWDLYPTLNSENTRGHSTDTLVDHREFLYCVLNVLNWADGSRSMLEIAQRIDRSIEQLVPVIRRLEQCGLLRSIDKLEVTPGMRGEAD